MIGAIRKPGTISSSLIKGKFKKSRYEEFRSLPNSFSAPEFIRSDSCGRNTYVIVVSGFNYSEMPILIGPKGKIDSMNVYRDNRCGKWQYIICSQNLDRIFIKTSENILPMVEKADAKTGEHIEMKVTRIEDKKYVAID